LMYRSAPEMKWLQLVLSRVVDFRLESGYSPAIKTENYIFPRKMKMNVSIQNVVLFP
jgi:hypothetical protein